VRYSAAALSGCGWLHASAYGGAQHDDPGVACKHAQCCYGAATCNASQTAPHVGCVVTHPTPACPRHQHPCPCPPLQAASLLGIGLLYQGSCQRLMAEIMMEELGRRPSSTGSSTTSVGDWEGYALAAGLALGLVCLGKGARAAGVADLNLEQRLRWGALVGAGRGAGCCGVGCCTPASAAATGIMLRGREGGREGEIRYLLVHKHLWRCSPHPQIEMPRARCDTCLRAKPSEQLLTLPLPPPGTTCWAERTP
jgi:hypothetical protein